ncbi:MAG: molybdopterin-guanine dinucleotide biosynthesis protein B [Pseudomonadales bacterium]
MRVIGVVGWKNSGKTTLLCALVKELNSRGLSVSTIKHTHHDIEIDQPGKDSYQHRNAGAQEVILATHKGWMLFHEQANEPELDELLSRLASCDIVLVEGYKQHNHPKIQVYRPDHGNKTLIGEIDNLIALASDEAVSDCNIPVLDLNNPIEIADHLLAAVQPV